MMYVALTYDHRLIDGREAVTFLKKIKQAVEDPRLMLLDLWAHSYVRRHLELSYGLIFFFLLFWWKSEVLSCDICLVSLKFYGIRFLQIVGGGICTFVNHNALQSNYGWIFLWVTVSNLDYFRRRQGINLSAMSFSLRHWVSSRSRNWVLRCETEFKFVITSLACWKKLVDFSCSGLAVEECRMRSRNHPSITLKCWAC